MRRCGLTRRAYKTSIPADAVEVVEEYYSQGGKKSACYFLGGEKVGRRQWDEEGWLDFECPLRNGARHGREYRFYPNGQPLDVDIYRHGRLHGLCRQWAEDGTLLVSSRMADGCGLSLWCDNCTGTFAEETYFPRKEELGYTRQWNGDERTVWQEYFFAPGKGYHGVWREWNARGQLCRGFPRFFVGGRKVTRRQYLRACVTDPTLPPYRPEDDDPHRELPAEYLAQKEKRRRGGKR
jgi:hypothetical protein